MKNDLPFYGRLAIVIVIVVALSEAMPEVVNYLLLLILIGLIVGHYKQFAYLNVLLGTVASGK